MKKIPLIAALMMCSFSAHASQMTYMPVNPSFGGSPLNGSYLMSVATANNHFKDNSGNIIAKPPTMAEQIAAAVASGVESQITQQIITSLYGENSTSHGSFDIGGGGNINFNTSADGKTITLNINDGQGGTTQLTIPKSLLGS